MPRLAGLEAVTAAPVLFFTVDSSANPRSRIVLKALDDRLGNSACCLPFHSESSLTEHLKDLGIPLWGAVRLQDVKRGSGFLSYTYHRKYDGTMSSTSALFSVGIHTLVDCESRAQRVANQLAADFQKHFLARIDNNRFPWGDSRKSRGTLHVMTVPRSFFPAPFRKKRQPIFDEECHLTQLGC